MYLCGTICGDYASSHTLSVDRSFFYERGPICFAFINLYYVMMDISRVLKLIDSQDGLSQSLGMEFLSTPEPNTCKARMKVDHRNRQPFGFYRYARSVLCVPSALFPPDGDDKTFLVMHRVFHVEVDIRNSNQELISTVSVTNYIIKPQSAPNTSGKSK